EFMDFKDDVIGCYLKLGNRWSEVSLNDSTFMAITPEIKHVKYILTTNDNNDDDKDEYDGDNKDVDNSDNNDNNSMEIQ
ncbi:6636_t:CDS:2, partial [Entrophospora sp. SA101]